MAYFSPPEQQATVAAAPGSAARSREGGAGGAEASSGATGARGRAAPAGRGAGPGGMLAQVIQQTLQVVDEEAINTQFYALQEKFHTFV